MPTEEVQRTENLEEMGSSSPWLMLKGVTPTSVAKKRSCDDLWYSFSIPELL